MFFTIKGVTGSSRSAIRGPVHRRNCGASGLSTGSYTYLAILLGRWFRGQRNSCGGVRSERGWNCAMWHGSTSSASWVENTIVPECKQESGYLQSMHLWVRPSVSSVPPVGRGVSLYLFSSDGIADKNAVFVIACILL